MMSSTKFGVKTRKGSRRTVVIALTTMALLLGSHFASANHAYDNSLRITHEPPATIDPNVDLTLTFSISGVSCGFFLIPDNVFTCSPKARIFYSVGPTDRSREAEVSVATDLHGSRKAKVTISGAELTSGSSFTYYLWASHGSVDPTCRHIGCLLIGFDESYEYQQTTWGRKTILISGDPPPNAPGSPTLSGSDHGRRVDVSWTQPSPNGAPITAFKLYRAEGSDSGDFELVASVGASQTSYSEYGVRPGNHRYVVAAVNSFGEGRRSNPVSVEVVGLADLIVTDVYSSASSGPSGAPGEWITFHATVRNIGEAAAASSTLSFLMSPESGSGTPHRWWAPTESIPAGQSVIVSYEAIGPCHEIPEGHYRLDASADSYSVVNENSEYNNVGIGYVDLADPACP